MPNEIVTANLKIGEKVYCQKEKCLAMSYWQKQSQNKPIILSKICGAFDVLHRKKADQTKGWGVGGGW